MPKWVYPNTLVAPGSRITLAGLTFSVVDLGPGGDSDANSIWLLEDERQAAFVGDFLYSKSHAYMMDGNILRWSANLRRFEALLSGYAGIYVGHGPPSDASLIPSQQKYFERACQALLDAPDGSALLTDESRKRYEQMMLSAYPGYGFTLTVAFSADALAKELAGVRSYEG